MYSYNRLRSKFDGRNILVDFPQECCGTSAEQAQKREEFAGVSQNPLKNRRRDTRTLLENRREGLRREIGTDGCGKSVKERGREKRKQSDEAIQKSALEEDG